MNPMNLIPNAAPRGLTEEQRDQLLAEIEELKEGRLKARKDARSGHPEKRAEGKRGVKDLTELITQRHRLMKEDDES